MSHLSVSEEKVFGPEQPEIIIAQGKEPLERKRTRMNGSSLLLLAPLIMLVGGMIASQNIVNPALSRYTGIVLAVLVSSSTTTLVMLILLLLGYGGEKATLSNLIHSPNYLWISGFLGVGVLSGAVMLLPRVGAASYLAFLVTGQLMFGMFFDQIGALGLTKFPITPIRVAGSLLLLVGARLILWR
ncbi:MAG TPA: DMT family transporter [Candidatus Baltobacteraceae bacterium]|nr:DMT family transporter [Candidatus Baltobacteraceae bacterium]